MSNKYLIQAIIPVLLSFFLSGGYCLAEVTTETSTEEVVQHEWATPIEREGLPNLHKVSEELIEEPNPLLKA